MKVVFLINFTLMKVFTMSAEAVVTSTKFWYWVAQKGMLGRGYCTHTEAHQSRKDTTHTKQSGGKVLGPELEQGRNLPEPSEADPDRAHGQGDEGG